MNSPKLRFPEFSDDWEHQKLSDVVKVFDGVHQTPDYLESGIMFLSVENIKTLKSDKFISAKAFERDFKIYPENGDVLMTRIGDVGTPNIVESDEKIAFYVSLALLKPKNIDPYFLCNLIRTSLFQKQLKKRTLLTAIPKKINKDEIGKVKVYISKQHDEQRKIGLFFSKIDELIKIQACKLNSLEQIKKGFLQKIFSQELTVHNFHGQWKQRYLFDCISKITDFRGRTPKKLGMEWSKEGYIALSANNVKNGYIDFSKDVHYGDDSLYKMWMTGNELHKGQVLFTTEAPMGNVAQIPDDKKYILSQRTIAFSVKKNVISEDFLALVLRSPYVKNKLYTLQSGGTAKGVSQKTLSSLKIRIPENLDDQNKLAGLFANFDKLITDQHRKIRLYEQIKKALLQQMFI